MKQTSYSLLLALTVACGAVDARELKLSCNWETPVQWKNTIHFRSGFVNYTFLLGDSNNPTAEDSQRIVVKSNSDGSTVVDIYEYYISSVKLSRDYLHFDSVSVKDVETRTRHSVSSHRINRETLMKETDDLVILGANGEEIVSIPGDNGQCQEGHQSIPKPKPAIDVSKPLPHQKF